MNYPRILLSIVLSQFLLISCEKEPDRSNDSVPPSLKGVFCINEGAFLASNGGVTFWPSDGSAGVVDLFSTANGFPAGDVLQSMRIHNGRAYLCVNNSQKIEVVSMADFKRLGTISGIAGPRYFLGLNDSLGVVRVNNLTFTKDPNRRRLKIAYPTTVGINELTYTYINAQVYPNPADDVVFIKGLAGETLHCRIYNYRGQMLLDLETAHKSISIKDLPAGFYTLLISDSKGNRCAKKLVINRVYY